MMLNAPLADSGGRWPCADPWPPPCAAQNDQFTIGKKGSGSPVRLTLIKPICSRAGFGCRSTAELQASYLAGIVHKSQLHAACRPRSV